MLSTFGKLLRKIRIDNDEILKDMANKLGVTASYLSAVENGKREVPDTWIAMIQKDYNLTDEDCKQLQYAAYEDKGSIKIDFSGSEEIDKELALSFARTFKVLDDKDKQMLKNILDKKREDFE